MKNMTLALAKKIGCYSEALVEKEYGTKPFSVSVCDKDGFTVLFYKVIKNTL